MEWIFSRATIDGRVVLSTFATWSGVRSPSSLRRQSASSRDRLDAGILSALALLVLWSIPIGALNHNGLRQSHTYAKGEWRANPNHLLYEPIGAAWQAAGLCLEPSRLGIDHLKRLSALCGVVALGLFRWLVAPRLAERRFQANLATATLALSSGFAALWISDETHMIQMPWLVLAAAALGSYMEGPSLLRAGGVGLALAGASLCFVSNLGLAASACCVLGFWQLRSGIGRWSSLLAVGLSSFGSVTAAFGVAWWLQRPPQGFLAWATSYGGGEVASRTGLAYGLDGSLGGTLEGAARAGYGGARALVELSSVVVAVRDGVGHGRGALAVVAFAALAVAMGLGLSSVARGRGRASANRLAWVLVLIWLPAVLGFGFAWNNSDDQFYFQLAVPFAALAARARAPGVSTGLAVLLLGGGLLFNVADVAQRRVLYPRAERLEALEGLLGEAGLVVFPGFGEVESLLAISRRAGEWERLGLTTFAASWEPEEGMRRIGERVVSHLEAGRSVVLVDIFDTPPRSNPWKFLRRLGYDRQKILNHFVALRVEDESKSADPFTARHIYPSR